MKSFRYKKLVSKRAMEIFELLLPLKNTDVLCMGGLTTDDLVRLSLATAKTFVDLSDCKDFEKELYKTFNIYGKTEE